jgi:two-component system, cell cycle sensor histidine kinase PleC
MPRFPACGPHRFSIAYLMGLFLALYAGMIGFQIHRDYRSTVEAAGQKAEAMARLLGEEVANYFTFVSVSLETLDLFVAKLPPVADHQESEDLVRSLMLANVKRLDMVRGYIILDARGQAVMDERGPYAELLDLSDRDYFRIHLRPGGERVFVGEPVVGRVTGKWFVSVSSRRQDGNGNFLGVITAVVQPEFLAEVLGTRSLGGGGISTLSTAGGTILARNIDHDSMIGQPVSADPDLSADGGAGPPEGLLAAIATTPARIVASAPVHGFPVTVTVSLDGWEILSPWRRKLPYYALALLLPSVAVAIAGTVLWRQQRALLTSEASLQLHVADLQDSRERLEEQAMTLAALAEQNAAAKLKAEAANTAKSLFLANMSHELRTPLNAVIGFGEMIERQDLGPVGSPDYVEYGRDIKDAGRHLLDMINDILDLSRIEADKYALHPEPLSLRETAGSCIRLLRGKLAEAGLVLETRMEGLPGIMADERAVRQVLINLLSNAIKFTPSGGRITLAAAADETCVRVTVSDTGVGIGAEDLPKLGRPFEQAGNQLRGKPSGSGLGLALCLRLVELHGGTMTIVSDVGRGTTVAFSLPLQPSGIGVGMEAEAV